MAADQRAPLRGDVAGVSPTPSVRTPRPPSSTPAGSTPNGLLESSASGGSAPSGPLGRLLGGGAAGNERLTALTGIVLMVLLAVIGVTLLRLRALISVHLFVGLLLIPPVLLKLASTGYRFARYYTSNRVYRERGAPPLLLRTSAPIVVLSTLGVFSTGVALLFVGPHSAGLLRGLHKASFIVWAAFFALHVLGHLPDLPRALLAKSASGFSYSQHKPGGIGRGISLAGALVGGIVLAILLVPHFGAWVHFQRTFVDR
ncbi:MAG: hypothetical protein ACTHM1_07100 [Solirubrobacteraceae bacterium]